MVYVGDYFDYNESIIIRLALTTVSCSERWRKCGKVKSHILSPTYLGNNSHNDLRGVNDEKIKHAIAVSGTLGPLIIAK